MSRVFEALTRAGEEKQAQFQPPIEEIESTLLATTPGDGKKLIPEHFVAISQTNGAAHETHELCSTVTNGEK